MLGWLRGLVLKVYDTVFRGSGSILRAGLSTEERALLQDLARRASCPVDDLSSHLHLPVEKVVTILSGLEEREFVRLSAGGSEHVRIAALTARGREAIAG